MVLYDEPACGGHSGVGWLMGRAMVMGWRRWRVLGRTSKVVAQQWWYASKRGPFHSASSNCIDTRILPQWLIFPRPSRVTYRSQLNVVKAITGPALVHHVEVALKERPSFSKYLKTNSVGASIRVWIIDKNSSEKQSIWVLLKFKRVKTGLSMLCHVWDVLSVSSQNRLERSSCSSFYSVPVAVALNITN